MKIIVIARSLNEERNIDKFCQSYNWADYIFIADGGSLDSTVERAKQYNNVQVQRFTERVSKNDGEKWRNPHGRHINFMVDWAEEAEANWIIFDDIDCFPNKFLSENCRDMLDQTPYHFALVNRIYMFGQTKYFETLSKPNGEEWNLNTSLYAWRTNMGFRADESNPWVHAFNLSIPDRHLNFYPPMAVIHDYYPDGNIRQEKVKFYRDSKEQPNCTDPLSHGGSLLDIEDWMKI